MGVTKTSAAFSELENRAAAMAGDDPLDRISLRDHLVEVEIGAFQSERGTTQRLAFNVVVEVLPGTASETDDVDSILSYDTITNAIQTELAAERLNLLETLAERIAHRILTEPLAQQVFVRIEKLDRGPGALGVEIVRSKAGIAEAAPLVDEPVSPIVVGIDLAAIASSHLTSWLDQLRQTGRPVFFVVKPQSPDIQVASPSVQRRIDLLAMEQAAWVLAAHDQRCVVVESRTELEHARETGMMAVWAPSKIILDAVEKPAFDIQDMPSIIDWFTHEFDAIGPLMIGVGWAIDPQTRSLDLVQLGL